MAVLPGRPRPPVFIMTAGTVGDIYPLLRIGLALERRGHAVHFLGPEIHQVHVQRSGLAFSSIISTADYLDIMNNPALWHSRKGIGVILRGLKHGAASLPGIAAMLPLTEPCVMLTHPLAAPAAAMLRAMRPALRIVTFYLAPSNLRSVHDPLTMGPLTVPRWMPHALRRWLWRRIDAGMVDPVALPDLNATRATLGLPPLQHFFEHIYTAGDHSLTLFPTWFANSPPDWPAPLHTGYFQLYDPHPEQQLPNALQAFLQDGQAPIVFTPGSGNRHAQDYFRQALKAAQRLGKRAIFLTPYREQIPASLPPSVFWQDYVPLRLLLPHVAAIVHHGGIGTTAEALRAGTPQLIVPLAFDQFDNAARVSHLGAGSSLSVGAVQRGRLTGALRRLLGSVALQEQCRNIARKFLESDDEDTLCAAIAPD
jgi:rhamnosyltransferase subunit B